MSQRELNILDIYLYEQHTPFVTKGEILRIMFRIHKQVRQWGRFRENVYGELIIDTQYKKADLDV